MHVCVVLSVGLYFFYINAYKLNTGKVVHTLLIIYYI